MEKLDNLIAHRAMPSACPSSFPKISTSVISVILCYVVIKIVMPSACHLPIVQPKFLNIYCYFVGFIDAKSSHS